MSELVFLLEEPSIVEVLKRILPPLVSDDIVLRFVPHQGKSDLENSISRTLRGWKTPGVRFVVVRDKDSGDCMKVKARIVELCKLGYRPDSLVRIVCPHLESWFLGDLLAVEKAFSAPGIAKRQVKRKYIDPDRLTNAEQELRKLIPRYQKIAGSRLIAQFMDVELNRSKSFQVFMSGVRQLVEK
jgi:hypothetical protein